MKKIVIIVSVFFLFLAISLNYGQLKKDYVPNYGYKLMPLEALDLGSMESQTPAKKLAKVADLPAVVDYTAFMPRVGDQGVGNACTGFAYAYALGEMRNKEIGYSQNNEFSPSFIFNLANIQNSGSIITSALAIVEAGCSKLQDFPYNQHDWQTLPDYELLEEAISNRVSGLEWFAIGNSIYDPAGTQVSPGYEGIDKARALLAEGKPVVIAIALTGGYGGEMETHDWICSYDAFGSWPLYGGHALCVVGYNDTLVTPDGMGAFKVINSWGADKFDNGYCWITYKLLALTNYAGTFVTFDMKPFGYVPEFKVDFQVKNFVNMHNLFYSGFKVNGEIHKKWLWSYRWDNVNFWNGVPRFSQPLPDSSIVDMTDLVQYIDTTGGENIFFISGNWWTEVFNGVYPEILSLRLVDEKLGIDTLIQANITITDAEFYAEWKFRVGKITDVENIGGAPSEFSLSQNYPNPFNPSTAINFSIAEKGFVTLKVFNLLGQEVALLVNEEKAAGHYNVNFNASQLASGMYVYRLQTENFTSTKKMILMK